MKNTIKIGSVAALAVLLFVAVSFVFPAAVPAKSPASVEGANFSVSSSINDNLKMYIGKEVLIHLRSGKSFQGYIKALGDHFVHLEKLAGRDFYDALIRIEDISAIEAKFRDMK